MSEVIRVVGVSFANDDGTKRQAILCKLYDDFWTENKAQEIKVELRHEPENAYDANAVAVWVTSPEVAAGKVGMISAEDAARLHKRVAAGLVKVPHVEDMKATSRGVSMALRVAVLKSSKIQDDVGRTYEF